MKKAVIFFFLLIGANSVKAQSIKLGPIAPLTYCVDDTMYVRYQTSGPFASDNYFFVELSDANGSFTSFTSVGYDTSANGSISIKLGSTGEHYHVRIASTDPYILSDSNASDIQVIPLPNPQADYGPVWAFIGDTIRFGDGGNEPSGSMYEWTFDDSDASIHSSQSESVSLTYSQVGTKSGHLTVTSPSGCTKSAGFTIYNILGCNPTIPQNTYIVNGTVSGVDISDATSVWVKTGGTYNAEDIDQGIVFVEPGAAVTISGNPTSNATIFYVKSGASVQGGTLQSGLHSVEVTDSGMKGIATYNLYCPDLTFDYSQIQPASVAENPSPTLSLIQSGDHLFANTEETPAEIRIMNILGAEVLSQNGRGELDIDLSPLPAGVYFAQVQSGDAREVRKIAVVH